MSPLLIALLGVLLIPLFVATWRTSLYGLAAQGFLMAAISYGLGEPVSAGDWLTLVDLVLVRGLWVPLALYGVLLRHRAPARNDVVSPNLFSWTVALAMVMIAFNFADQLGAKLDDDQQTLVAVSAIAILLALLILSTQSGVFSQMVGVLRIENGIALFELGGHRHHPPIAIQIAQIVLVTITIAYYRWQLDVLAGDPARIVERPEAPTL